MGVDVVSDMCLPEHEDLCRWDTDMKHFDENTSEELDSEKVVAGERAELESFKKMDVNNYEMREVATNDEIGNFVKVKCVRTNKGTPMDQEVRCRLVCTGAADGRAVRWNSFFDCNEIESAPRSQWEHEHGIMVVDAKCVLLYGKIRQRAYIGLSRPDHLAPAMDPWWEILRNVMYGTRDAPQIWQNEVRKVMKDLGFDVERFAFVGLLPPCAKRDRGGPRGRLLVFGNDGRTCNDCVGQWRRSMI